MIKDVHASSPRTFNFIKKGKRMPYFSSCCPGADEYICQKCGKIKCDKCQPPSWRPDITGYKSAGNVCPTCLKNYEELNNGNSK